jgi:pimeloyl-ACP methyl ester carboxylesterase
MELLSHLSIEKATFIGWSLGSAISISLALTYPQTVQNLILIAASPVFFVPDNDDFPGIPPQQAEMFLNNVRNDYNSWSEQFVLQQYPEATGSPRPNYVDEALADAALLDPEVAYTIVNLSGRTDFRLVLGEIVIRTLIINGVEDPFCLLSSGKWMHEMLEDCTFIPYVGCGHVPFVGPFAEKFNTDVEIFLAGSTILNHRVTNGIGKE